MIDTFYCDEGDKVRVTATFTDVDDASAVTPTTVSFRVLDPSGTSTTYVYGVDGEVSLVSTGVYRLLLDCDYDGQFLVRAWSTGTGQAAESGSIQVFKDPTA